MNILISITDLTIGGGELLPINLANELCQMGHEVTLHVLYKNREPVIEKRLNPKVSLFCSDNPILFTYYVKKNKIEVINTHNYPNQRLVCSVMPILKLFGVRHVATVHGVYEARPLEEAKKILRKLDRNVCRWVYVAENSHMTLERVGIAKEKLVKINNALPRPAEIIKPSFSEYGIPENASVVTVISRAVGKKCWPESIQAVVQARKKSNKNIHLILAGIGEVYEKLMKEELPDFVHLIGATEFPCSIYASSDIGMLLSIRECAPLGLIEMYYAGIPVIATDTGDVAEMMTLDKERYTGILLPLKQDSNTMEINIEAASNAIVRMLTDHELYHKSKENAIQKAKEFSVRRMAEKYVETFLEKK